MKQKMKLKILDINLCIRQDRTKNWYVDFDTSNMNNS